MTDSYKAAIAKQATARLKKSKREAKAAVLWPKKVKRKKSPSLSKLKKLLWEELRFVVYAESPVCRACGQESEPVACHIVPSSDAAATKFFLPNIYRGCAACNCAENRRRAQWVKRHEEIFGVDFVNALYDFSQTEFQLKKHWVLEQTERMRKLRGTA
jgi:hypothetical protein